ncbi:helix-turn-helix transcriptional regulator [Hymenobacter negativus]|uniref:Helix-turn-helix transcriptional regulator n=1 Tax=Hymenobacter negativus TaxID=2795026 RepID=A0ABS3QMT2_9BACT|nr:helix-turn-helix transcriptional regulator [Hymenobacter negativus]MBO2012571.1 helix-turn-helix transcriptional regulator [Hymenobacter negativus]
MNEQPVPAGGTAFLAAPTPPSIDATTALTAWAADPAATRLREFIKSYRLAHKPKLTQLELSRMLGYTYSIVTAWENGTRIILASQLVAWAQALDVPEREVVPFVAVARPDGAGHGATGSRMDAEVNARLKWLRKELRFSLREMANMTGISAGHLQRIESNQSNVSVAQVRNIHQKLKVSYEWLIDGTGTWDLRDFNEELARLRRENQLLEQLRQLHASQSR